MVIHLLCPGPSLASYEDDHGGIVLGVNSAVTRIRCDGWVCLDEPAVAALADHIKGMPMLVTSGACAQRVADLEIYHGRILSAEAETDPSLLEAVRAGVSLFSGPTAAAWAASWWPLATIEVYGCDLVGSEDVTGVRDEAGRTEDRWRRERGCWERIEAATGGRVRRIGQFRAQNAGK